MRYIRFVLLGSVIALLGAMNAEASVIYQWHSTGPGTYVPWAGYTTATGGELVFTNAAYFSGSVDFYVEDPDTSPWVQYGGCPPYYVCRIINSPVKSANLNFDNQGLWVSSQPGSQWFLENQFLFGSTITFNNDGTLTGVLDLQDESDVASASGSHYSWDVYGFASDYFLEGECTGTMFCDGGSGYWQLSSVTPVPEPPAWSLFGFGVVGLFSLLGWRRKA